MSRTLSTAVFAALLAALVVFVAAPVAAASTPASQISVDVPATAAPDAAVAVTVTLPANVAAVDGRVFFKSAAAELLGVAPLGKGTALMPVTIRGGAAFGAYGLHSVNGATVIRLVMVPHTAGRMQLRVIIDATADALGHRLALSGGDRLGTLGVGGGTNVLSAPAASGRTTPTAMALPVRALDATSTIDKRDLDTVRSDWTTDRALGTTCAADLAADANGDGCVDIVDVQAVLASQGQSVAGGGATVSAASKAAAVPQTYTVTSTADTPDASPGNGTCADSQGRCTLRAAMTEADYHSGPDTIAFNLPGTAPVTIQLTSQLPIITSLSGGVLIDGYTQPGSVVNTATYGTNGVPGVEIRGTGTNSGTGIRVTSPNNTIRGVAIDNWWRGITLDGVNAHDNHIVGDWLGFRRDGTLGQSGEYAILLNTGANHNFVGSSALADRNVDGNFGTAVNSYGTGTDFNTIQGNLLCISPSGGQATCATGIDHNFGPKNELAGGTGVNEGNVIGPTTLQGIEYSHGWNPAQQPRQDNSVTWQINNNRAIGNWVGFREDGAYDPAYRSGSNQFADNGQGINVYDGDYDNLVDSNYISAVYDGVDMMAPNSQRTTVSNNIIGVSPHDEAAPMSGWGVRLKWATKFDVIVGNTIRNAATGGVGLIEPSVYNIKISQNIITDTNGPAIYLAPNGSTGANTLLKTPVLTSATTALVSGTGIAGATVEVYKASRPAGQFGLPTAYLGSAIVANDKTWSVAVSLQSGDLVTALQIRTDENTSQLAANVAVVGAPPPPQPGDLLANDDFARTVSSGWGTATMGADRLLGRLLGDHRLRPGLGGGEPDARGETRREYARCQRHWQRLVRPPAHGRQ